LPSKKKYDWNNFTNPLHEQVWQTSLGINASRQPMVVGEKSTIDFLALTAPHLAYRFAGRWLRSIVRVLWLISVR